MPESPTVIDESEVWAALQLDTEPNGDSPPVNEPVDAAFVRFLIQNAERRIERFCAITLADEEEVAPELKAAIQLDVSVHYFNRLNPELPNVWSELIAPHRQWGFGGTPTEGDT